MSSQMPKVDNSGGGIQGIAQLFNTLSPLFGSGKKKGTSTITESSSADPAAMSQLDELLKQILGGGDEKAIDDMVANILTRAKQEFGPAMLGSKAAGVRGYSDTVRAQMANEAMARATGEAAGAKLKAMNDANRTAAGLVEAKVNATRTQTRQQQEQGRTGASPLGQALGLGLSAAQIYSMFKKKKLPGMGNETPAMDSGGVGDVVSSDIAAGSNYDTGFSADFDTNAADAIGGAENNAMLDQLILESNAAGGATNIDPEVFTSAGAGPDDAVSILDPATYIAGNDPRPIEEIITSQGLEVGKAMPPAQAPGTSMPPADISGTYGMEPTPVSYGGEDVISGGEMIATDEALETGAAEGGAAAGIDLAGYSEYVPYAASLYTATQGNTRGAIGGGVGTFVGNYLAGPIGGMIGAAIGGTYGPRVIEHNEDLWANEIGDDILGFEQGGRASIGLSAVADPISHITSDDTTTEQKIDTAIDPLGSMAAEATGMDIFDPIGESGIGEKVGEIGADILEGAEDVIDEVFGGGGCFITTAATYNGELDNGFTLQTLREFRDSWMQETPERRSELLDYYLLAPIVVKRINESANPDRIWQIIREKFLAPAVTYYYMDMPYKTHEVYQEMMYWARQQVGLANPA